MADIQFLAPETLDEAVGAFAAADASARILAGGTDLLVQMQSGMVAPGLIIDIKKITEVMDIGKPPKVDTPSARPFQGRCWRPIRTSARTGRASSKA